MCCNYPVNVEHIGAELTPGDCTESSPLPTPAAPVEGGRDPPRHPPLDDKVDVVPLLQDPLEFGDAVGAGPFEGDFVRDADDFHRLGVARDLPIWDGDHVV